MASAVAAKSEEKESKAKAPENLAPETPQPQQSAGAPAGLPRFLRGGAAGEDGSSGIQGKLVDHKRAGEAPAKPHPERTETVAATPRSGELAREPQATAAASQPARLGEDRKGSGRPGDQAVINREVTQVTSDPTIRARRTEGGPVLLVPPEKPPSPQEQARGARSDVRKRLASAAPAPPVRKDPKAGGQPVAEEGRQTLRKAAPRAETGAAREARQKAGRGTAAPLRSIAARRRSASGPLPARGGPVMPGGAPRGRAAAPTGAATAMVPPAAPEMLRAQLPKQPPTREEFVEALASGRNPADSRAQAAALVEKLRSDARLEKAPLEATATQHKAAIGAEAESRAQSIAALAATHRSAIRGHIAAASQRISQQAEQRKTLVPEQVAKDVSAADAAGALALSDAQSQAGERKTAIVAFAEEQQSQPSVIANQESSRASGELERAALECERAGREESARYPGDDDPKPAQRSAAEEVGTRSAADIREKKPDIAEDLQSRAADFGGHYMEYAAAVEKQIDDALAQLVPALQQNAASTADSIRQTGTAALHAMDGRLHTDLDSLRAAESAALGQLANSEHAAVQQIHSQAEKMSGAIDEAGEALAVSIDRSVDEVADVVSGYAVPNLPGINDIVGSGRLKVQATAETGRSQLANLEASARENLQATQAAFERTGGQVVTAAQSTASSVASRNSAALDHALQARSQQATGLIADLRSRTQGMTQSVMQEIDRAAEKARGEMRGITDKFRTQVRQAADESIEKATKPRTDPVETRAADAAHQAGESWYMGLFRALGQIVIGLVIMVVLALIIAGIAALFGVILTAWTAIMIAGAILLAIGLVIALIHRAGQKELQGHPGEVILLALSDTIGVTGIVEGISGHDIVTDQALSDADRTERGVLGAVTLITLVLGVRSAIKGPPGGVFMRPGAFEWPGFGEFFSGGWREYLPAAGEAIKNVAVEMYEGLRGGIKDIGDWIRKRFGKGDRPPAVPDQPPDQPPPQQPDAAEVARQQRLEELSRDPDRNNGIPDDQTRGEAEVALALEERGELPARVRRPQPGDGHSGDFVDGNEVDWDVKAEYSRQNLIDKIKAEARAAGRPEPNIDPTRPLRGEYNTATVMEEIRGELAAGENVILDTRNMSADDIRDLRAAVQQAGLGPRVKFYP